MSSASNWPPVGSWHGHASEQAFGLVAQHFLQDLLVWTEIRNQLLQLPVLLPQDPSTASPAPTTRQHFPFSTGRRPATPCSSLDRLPPPGCQSLPAVEHRLYSPACIGPGHGIILLPSLFLHHTNPTFQLDRFPGSRPLIYRTVLMFVGESCCVVQLSTKGRCLLVPVGPEEGLTTIF